MMRLTQWLAAAALALSSAGAAAAEDQRIYVFGNSLMNYATDTPETAVPYWLGVLSEADGTGLALDGQWGFMWDFASDLPPKPKWSFPNVARAWNGRSPFGEAGFTAVIMNPANFTQYRRPDETYEANLPEPMSPLSTSLAVLDWVQAEAPGTRIALYEGWADMGTFVRSFPPNRRELRRYHGYNMGDYHDWYVAWAEMLRAARPDLRVDLLPVASVMSELLTSPPLDAIPAEALYTDDAPHGTGTTYLLAAMIVYAGLYDSPLPDDVALPDSVHPALRENYAEVARRIEALLGEDRDAALAPGAGPGTTSAGTSPEPASRTAGTTPEDAPLPATAANLPPAVAAAAPRPDPKLAMGLNGITDWTTQLPFIDVFKTSRPWIGHSAETWGAFSHEDLRAGGHLTPEGWPRSLPEGADRLEAFMLTGLPEEATSAAGQYVMRWEGTGRVEVVGRSRLVRHGAREIVFNFTPGEGTVAAMVKETDRDDPVRNITVVRADHLALHEAGAVFNPDWLARVADLRSVRFMDWMNTNGSPVARWEDRPRPEDATWAARGVPLDVMIRLANEIGADPWFNIPHLADDDYVRRFAEQVRDTLDPRLVAYAECSNELWNRIFPQAVWIAQEAEARWGETPDGWVQMAGLRAAEVADIWREVYGPEAAERLRTVIATHTGWPGLEEALLEAPRGVAEGARPPVESFDAYAVTGYFGFEMGGEDWAPRIKGWLEKGGYDLAAEKVAEGLREGSLGALGREIWPYHAGVAARHGLDLVMYEGGTHVVGHGPRTEDAALTDFYTAFNYGPRMAALYDTLLADWRAAGGTLFNAFVDVGIPSRWGSWGALRHLDDANPRWDVLMAYNAGAPGWEERAPGTFLHGVIRRGGDGADRLSGTPEEDTLLGGPGDDVLDGQGGADRLHGGPGTDRAVLPGTAADWRILRGPDGALRAEGPRHTVRLVAVEEVAFADEPELVLLTASL